MMEALFWIVIGVIIYIYAGYPLLLTFMGRSKSTLQNEDITPVVTLFIAAHNEERVIEQKLENCTGLDYPKDKLEIVIASDCSTDQTVAISKRFADKGVRLFKSQQRKGKNGVINTFIDRTRGEIIVFTDANAFYEKDAIRKLVRGFGDPRVGCVVGKLRYVDENTSVAKGEGLYFRYESIIKELESKLGTVVAATGSIYAIRKALFMPLDRDVANDFAHPIQIASKGYRIIFEPGAVAYERATSSIHEEFRRRSRIVNRGITAFLRYYKQYKMLKGVWGFCFISHKLLRWLVPFFLLILLQVNLFLNAPVYQVAFLAQVFFYATALIGSFIRNRTWKIFSVPFYFCLVNLAALRGIIQYATGSRQSMWDVAKTTR